MRLLQIIIAIDQLANAVLGGFADESLSARAHRNDKPDGKRRWKLARKVIDGLFFFERNHCYNAWKSEIERRQYPPEYRG